MDEFYRTRMGVRFFESTLPRIAEELERLNANLEALAKVLAKSSENPNDPDERRSVDAD